jgi:hypothetical protein
MQGRTLRVKCASWDQVEAFYLRKLRRGRGISIRVPFVPSSGDPIAVGLELPTGLVVIIDGTVAGVHPAGDDRATIDIDLQGLTSDVVDRLEALVADGRLSTPPTPEAAAYGAGDAARRVDDPAHDLVVQLDGELRRLRQLAVHETLGVVWDASAIEVRAAWRQLCQRFHPDAVASHGSAAVSHLAEELMILVNRAYDRMRSSLVAEGRASSLGPALRPEKGWLVSFDAISTGREIPAPGKAHASEERAISSGTTDTIFEKQARIKLAAGEHEAAREVLAAALYVYPRNQALRALYHVASAMKALDAGQAEHAAAQLEAALSADADCREARAALDKLRRGGP